MLPCVATPTADSCVRSWPWCSKDFPCSVTRIFVFCPWCCVGWIQECSSHRREVNCCFAPFDKGTRTRLRCEVFEHYTVCYRTGRATFKLHLHLHPLVRFEGPGSSGCWHGARVRLLLFPSRVFRGGVNSVHYKGDFMYTHLESYIHWQVEWSA